MNKLGFHIDCNREYGGQFEAIGASPPPVVVALINPNDPGKAAPYLANVPYLVLRYKTAGRGEDAMIGTDGLDANSSLAYSQYKPYLAAYPKAYWMYYRNEIGDWSKWDKYAEEMVSWIEILAANGYRAAVGGFSVGTPDYPIWNTQGMARVLDACEKYGALLNLHEYALNGLNGDPHTLLRYRQPAPKAVLGMYPKAKVVIGELGKDVPGGTWKQIGNTPEEYLAFLRGYNSEIVKDAQVVGAAVYQWSNAEEWRNYDIAGPVTQGILADVRASTPNVPPIQEIPPAIPQPYVRDVRVVSEVNQRAAPDRASALLGAVKPGARLKCEFPSSGGYVLAKGQGFYVLAANLQVI